MFCESTTMNFEIDILLSKIIAPISNHVAGHTGQFGLTLRIIYIFSLSKWPFCIHYLLIC